MCILTGKPVSMSQPNPPSPQKAGSTVREKILALFDELSPKHHQLARYFLDHEERIIFASASEIGSSVGASAATVVRFARALGYEGYTDLQAHIRSTLSPNLTASQMLAERIKENNFSRDIAARVAEVNTYNIRETLKQVSPDILQGAVNVLLDARQVRVFGSGMSAAAAVMAGHSLWMLGIPARAVVNGGLNQTIEIDSLAENDTVIVISIWRYLRETVEALHHAKALGTRTIALTDSLASPVARTADYVFVAETERASHSRSLTGIISLIDLINATIISQRPEESMIALQHIDDSYQQQGRLLEDL